MISYCFVQCWIVIGQLPVISVYQTTAMWSVDQMRVEKQLLYPSLFLSPSLSLPALGGWGSISSRDSVHHSVDWNTL